jgi:hypothetical protein
MTARPSRELLKVVRATARLAEIYWHDDCFPKEFKAAERGWLPALVQFTAGYAYERQGAAPVYRTFARESLTAAAAGLGAPTASLPEAVWQDFVRRAQQLSVGPNGKVNPLAWSKNSRKVSSVEFARTLRDEGFSILRWAARMVREGHAEAATTSLRGIRGVGWKLAAFYLRDVARFYALAEEPAWCFQPVDVWIRRIAGFWAARTGRSVASDNDAATVFVDLARAAEVRGGDLNAGAWILGSQLLDGELEDIVCSWRHFSRCMTANHRWNEAISSVLRPLMT